MKTARLSVRCVALFCLAAFSSVQASAAETLQDKLDAAGWGGIIGTWVDADSGGSGIKISYQWKIDKHVIEVTSTMRERQSVALMGVNGKTGDVFHMGADDQGTSSLGKWEVEDNGDAVLGIQYTTADGTEGTLNIRFHKEGKDAVTMTIELPEPIRIKMIRSK